MLELYSALVVLMLAVGQDRLVQCLFLQEPWVRLEVPLECSMPTQTYLPSQRTDSGQLQQL